MSQPLFEDRRKVGALVVVCDATTDTFSLSVSLLSLSVYVYFYVSVSVSLFLCLSLKCVHPLDNIERVLGEYNHVPSPAT